MSRLVSPTPHFDFLNGLSPDSFSFIFGLFKSTLHFTYNKIMLKNVHPVYGAGIRTHALQDARSPPITTRPGLSRYLSISTLGIGSSSVKTRLKHTSEFFSSGFELWFWHLWLSVKICVFGLEKGVWTYPNKEVKQTCRRSVNRQAAWIIW